MTDKGMVTVFGASGHTGRFVVAELHRRGWTPVLSGRDAERLQAVGAALPHAAVRPASVDAPTSLDDALDGAAAVINCAGPFAVTAEPVIDTALRAGIPYLDVAAEVEVAVATFTDYADRARVAGILVVPAIAFYGGLGDLLATAAMGDWSSADEISLAYALSSWKPTLGTRATIETSRKRRDGRRLVYANRQLDYRTDDAPIVEWRFPEPIGTQTVVAEFLTADSVTIPQHLWSAEIHTYMTAAPLGDLADPDLSPPAAVDESGRSSQTFLVEAVVRRGTDERRAVARGRDIYAITAPLVVEATERVLAGPKLTGVAAAGAVFDARDFLESLSPEHLTLDLPSPS